MLDQYAAPNSGKKLAIKVSAQQWSRIPIRTHIVTDKDDIITVAKKYALHRLKEHDLLFISERIVSISQGRAFPVAKIKPSFFANTLSKLVHKSPYGIGLASPWTMELAIREVGLLRILFAAGLSAITKIFGIRGIFYKVAGKNINAIDGPCDYTLPPYNKYAKLGPAKPNKVAIEVAEALGCQVVIIDANDLGVAVLGKSSKDLSDQFCQQIFKDNPLGQSSEQTPMAIVRKMGTASEGKT